MKFYWGLFTLLAVAIMVSQTEAEDTADEVEDDTIDCLYQKPDCVCLEYEEPVCSINGCTYGNDCKRVCADAEYAYEGACHEDDLDYVE